MLFGAVGARRSTLVVVLAIPLGAFGAYRLGRTGSSASAGPRSPPGSRTGSTPSPATRSRRAASARWCCSRCCRSCSLRVRRGSATTRDDDPATRAGPAPRGARRAARRVVPGRARPLRARRRSRSCSRSRSRAASARRSARSASRSSRSLGRHRAAVPVAARVRARAASTRRRSASRSAPTSTSRRSCASTPGRRRRGLGDVGLLIVAAAVPLFVATGDRLAWAARGWVLALVGWAAVWVPARFFPDTSVLAPEAGLTLAALGLALVRRHRGVGARRRHPHLPVRVAPTGGDPRRRRDPAPRARVHRRRVRRPVGRAARGLDQRPSRSPQSLSRARASSACCGSGDPGGAAARSGRARATAPGTRSPATAPATSPSSGARPSTTPTTWSTARSCSRPRGSPTGSAGCSRRWACATSCVPSTQGTRRWRAGRRPGRAARARMAQQLDLARLRSSPGLVLYENLAYAADPRPRCTPPALPIDSRRPEPRRARRPTSPRGAARGPGATAAGHRVLGRGLRLGVEGDRRRRRRCATQSRSAGPTGTRRPQRGDGRRSRSSEQW